MVIDLAEGDVKESEHALQRFDVESRAIVFEYSNRDFFECSKSCRSIHSFRSQSLNTLSNFDL
jgi:hypothetical protein